MTPDTTLRWRWYSSFSCSFSYFQSLDNFLLLITEETGRVGHWNRLESFTKEVVKCQMQPQVHRATWLASRGSLTIGDLDEIMSMKGKVDWGWSLRKCGRLFWEVCAARDNEDIKSLLKDFFLKIFYWNWLLPLLSFTLSFSGRRE